jgi:AAA+ superfamily predicted ATPase
MIEQDQSHSLILAATNHMVILDHALFRRFDDVMQYSLPDTKQIATLLKARLAAHVLENISWANLSKAAVGLSFADITCATEDVLKAAIIDGNEKVTQDAIHHMICERQNIRGKMKGNFESKG